MRRKVQEENSFDINGDCARGGDCIYCKNKKKLDDDKWKCIDEVIYYNIGNEK